MNLNDLSPVPLPGLSELTETVWLGKGTVSLLPDAIARYLGDRVFCLADPETWNAFTAAHPPSLPDTVCRCHKLSSHPHADVQTVDRIIEKAHGCSGILAIGSGTINDLAKMTASQINIPYIVAGTAASMNGYASAIAAILEDGLKTTKSARPPRAIILDTDILKEAPFKLTQAGLGDLISKPVSNADYWLCHQMENSGFSQLPGQIVDRAIGEAKAQAPGLLNRSDDAFQALAKALVLSGVSMVVAGSSSPASGGEHLISHLWDMEAHSKNCETNLHGEQVGVSTCISAALYHQIMQIEKPEFATIPSWDDEEKRIQAEFGILAEAILPQARRKHEKTAARLDILQTRWNVIRNGLMEMNIPSPETIRSLLQSISAPASIQALGFNREYALRTIRLARDIRDRYTVLDLAFELGLFPDAMEAVLDQSGVCEIR